MPRFGQFRIDPAQRLLSRGTEPLHLTPKAFDLLCMLVAAAPRVLTKTELHARVWPDTIVSDATLTGLVKELRRTLDDHDREAPLLRTVHGVGFAFCAALESESPQPRRIHGWLVIGERRLPVTTGAAVIGRDPDVELWIDFDTISRRHARLVASDDGVWLQDLGSKNGTRIADRPADGSVPLRDGDRIVFGRLTVTWRAQSSIAATRSHDANSLALDVRR
jgi:DNA-binding winged helix-turn-helix (wHTH) protein